MNLELIVGLGLFIFGFHTLESFGPKTKEQIVWSIVSCIVGGVLVISGCVKLVGAK